MIVVWKIELKDTETGKFYETGYKFDHSRFLDDVDSALSEFGGVEGATQAQIIKEVD